MTFAAYHPRPVGLAGRRDLPAILPAVPPERAAPWVVLQTRRGRWGGDLRRAHIFRVLAERTGAVIEDGLNRATLERAVRRSIGRPIPWLRRVNLASPELLTPGAVVLARRITHPVALDVHDEPVAQADALGVALPAEVRRAETERLASNLAAFALHVVPSASFAELIGLDARRVIVAPNGSDTDHVIPEPWPDQPALGFVSGAAPGRGIEDLVEAARALRSAIPELRLLLWLAASGPDAERYLAGLRAATERDAWVEIAEAPYERLSAALGRATVLVIPHPANAYTDVAVPVKLLDSMAAGRPVVVTPRIETRRIVEAAAAGRVTAGDAPDDLAATILPLLQDAGLARRLGANGRAAAVQEFDWRVIGGRVADAVLARDGHGR